MFDLRAKTKPGDSAKETVWPANLASTTALPAASSTFGDRYRIEKELGHGGMGQVFVAHDIELDRDVALKVLWPGEHDEQDQLRFQQEARAAGALEHPNVVAVHDAGTQGGTRYIISELLRGKTLREALLDKPLPLRTAVDYARQLAQGLGAAHEKGVIHRDLKPENLFITDDGTLKILDFGIAKLESKGFVPGPGTVSGAIVGTVGYMSPEQVQGRPVDRRADIFGFGAILYEMLSGKRAFARRSPLETAYAILNADPGPLPHSIPRQVAAIVRRCLAKDPALRYPSAREVLAALEQAAPRPGAGRWWRRIIDLALLAIALGWTAAAWRSPWVRARLRELGKGPHIEARQLALLPFSEQGGGPDGEAFSAGVVEILNQALRRHEQLRDSLHVVSPNEVAQQGVATARDARRAFGATLALTGSMLWMADKVMATVELVDTRSQEVLAARAVSVPRKDAWSLPGHLLRRVSEMLELQLRPETEGALDDGRAIRLGAYEFYLQGRGYLQRYDRKESLDNAMELFQKALARDPGYAPAWAGQAEGLLRRFKVTRELRLLADARANATRAIELDGRLAAARVTMGLIEVAAGEPSKGIASLTRALELEPGNVDAVRELANAYDAAGRTQDSEATLRHAIELRPSYWVAYKDLGLFYNRHNRIEEAIPAFKSVIDLTPDNYAGYSNLAAMYLRLGRHAEAAALLERSLALNPTAQAYSNLGTVYYFQKRYGEAAENYVKALELSPMDDRTWGNLADAYRWVPGKADASARAYREAVAAAQKQLAVNPREAELRSRLAMYESSLGDREGALREINEALRTAPAEGLVLFRSALVYEQSGMRDRALAAVGAALAGGFSREEIEKAPPLAALRKDARYRKLSIEK